MFAFHQADDFILKAILGNVHEKANGHGLQVSYHIAEDSLEDEVNNLVESEHIDLIVVSAEKGPVKEILQRIIPQMSTQIIQVRGKGKTTDLVQ